MKIEDVFHLSEAEDWTKPECGAFLTPHVSPLPTTNTDKVNCPDCLKIMADRSAGVFDDHGPVHYIHRGVRWHQTSSAPYRCGAMGDQASSAMRDVTCPECLTLLGVGASTPLHTPPRMEDERGMTDGVFIFHDVHDTEHVSTMEVVPQLSGNVEITLGYKGEGVLFTLSHTDRADLLRALLHDFHYSPERGGPNDD